MSYRDILVQVDEKTPSAARAAAAADLARRAGGFLTGVFLQSNFLSDYMAAETLAYMSPPEIDALLKDHAKAVGDASEKARMTFEAAAASAGVKSEWRIIPGDDDRMMLACARCADLTVFPAVAQVSMARYRIAAGNLAMAVGGPVLVTPDKGYPADCGRRILIAWNGSRESARALRDAWPLVMAADEVHVLVVAPEGDAAPDGLLQRHLERHGCAANVIVDPSLDEAASDILRRQIKSLQADMLVMGLYGRPRFQELVLGGVSREMLAEPPVPILLSH
ncbi:MAG: universal stress protein [Caulobacter sp.]|nr:universal stress protein [Caulobacter sp.]